MMQVKPLLHLPMMTKATKEVVVVDLQVLGLDPLVVVAACIVGWVVLLEPNRHHRHHHHPPPAAAAAAALPHPHGD